MLLRFFFPIISFVVWLLYKFDKFVQVKVIQRRKEHLQKYWIEPPYFSMKYSHQLQACEYSCLSSLLVIRDASFRRAWRNGCIRLLSHDSLPPTVLLRRQSGWVLDTCHEIENERKKG